MFRPKLRGGLVSFPVTLRRWWVLAVTLLGLGGLASQGANNLWTGNSNQFWIVGANWTNGVPKSGDNLFFTQSSLRQSTINNLLFGTTFGRLTLASSLAFAYTLSGSPITLTNGIVATGAFASSAPQVLCDIKLGNDQIFSSGRSLVVSNLDLNSHGLLLGGSGSITCVGNFINSGANPDFVTGAVYKTNSGTFYIAPGATFQVSYDGSGGIIPVLYPSMGIINGNLRVDGAATNAFHGVYIVLSGGTSLTGTGVVDIVGFADSAAVLSPGNNGPGVLEVDTINGGGYALLLDINGTTAGTDYDQLVTGTLPDASSLFVTLGYQPLLGDAFLVARLPVPGIYPLAYGDLIETTNGYTFGYAVTSNGVALTTVRRPDSPFTLWRGAATSGAWSQTNNWSAGIIPSTTSGVVFSEYSAQRVTVSNDLPAGSTIASMQFSANGYGLLGNALTVSGGITNQALKGTNSILMDLVTVGTMVFDVAPGGTTLFTRSFNGSGTVRKTDGGTLRYTGTTANSFAGSVTMDGGLLQVDGSFTDGSFGISGGTLGGTGTVSSVTMTGGTLASGNGRGVFHVQGNLAMAPGAVFQVELNGPLAGSSYDQLQVNGTVNLNGATLNVQPGFAATVGNAFLVLVNDGTDAITGTFAGLPEGAIFSAGGQYFSISYQAGSGNDVVLTRVDPPLKFSSVVLLSPGVVQLKGIGSSNVNYSIQANTNIATTNWTSIGSAPADGSGNFFFNVSNVGSFPHEFFRLAVP